MKKQMRMWLGVSVVWLMSSLFGPLYAQTDAYTVEVAVFDRSSDEQADAYGVALRRVLLSNSGDKTLLNRNDIRAGLKQAETYVQSFSYRTPAAGTVIASDTPITQQVQQTGQATQLMLVRFDRSLVNTLIGASSTSSTNTNESEPQPAPLRVDSALVWLLIQDEGRDILISDPAALNVQSRAREIAGAAGISLVYPAGDDEDRQSLSIDDIVQQNVERITAASERYRQDVVLSGTLSRRGARGWLGEWVKITGEQQRQRSFETASLDEALQQGLRVLNAESAIDEGFRYGGLSASDTEALIWVGSLDSTSDYASMMKFFEAVPSVSTVYAKEIQQTSMVFSVVPRTALTDIESAVFNAGWLQRSSVPFGNQPNSLSRNADLAIEYGR